MTPSDSITPSQDMPVSYETTSILAVVEAAHNVCEAADALDNGALETPLAQLHDALTDLEAVDGMGLGPVYSAREIIRSRLPPAAAGARPPAEAEELVAELKRVRNIGWNPNGWLANKSVNLLDASASALTSLSLRVKELEEALSKIEGGWIDEDIPEDDPHDQFSAALQRIARAVLPESAIRRARTFLHGEGGAE
jgi:hypothetical protein